jgi:hypothetical protein
MFLKLKGTRKMKKQNKENKRKKEIWTGMRIKKE